MIWKEVMVMVCAVTFVSLSGTGMRAASVHPMLRHHRTLMPADYAPSIAPEDFTTHIDNPYFTLSVGKRLVYQVRAADNSALIERIEIMIPGWTRRVNGVLTLVFWDRVYKNGQLIEDTRDYIAQHRQTGDVWYFGEHVDNYENGVLTDHEGQWLAGENGAQPGRLILGTPIMGAYFINEYLPGEAQDDTLVVGLHETVHTPVGAFSGCVKHLDGSPLFSEFEHTYYCADDGVQGTVYEAAFNEQGELEEIVELMEIDLSGASDIVLPAAYERQGVVPARSK
jgi:hypothetical protein